MESPRESEQFLRTIIATGPECVKVVDSKGELLAMNKVGLDMLEAETHDAINQYTLLDFIVCQYRDSFTALHKRVISGESASLEYEKIMGLKGARRCTIKAAEMCSCRPSPATSLGASMPKKCRRLWKNCERLINSSLHRVVLAFIRILLAGS